MKVHEVKENDMVKRLREMQSAASSMAKSTENTGISTRQRNLIALVKRVEMMDSMMYMEKMKHVSMKMTLLMTKKKVFVTICSIR